jgi:PHD/YefM family antitoxin component YafN of YafNO toxin-antitoxin module
MSSLNILDSLVSITQFNRGQASKIFDRLNKENQLVVLKNNQPAAIILSPAEFNRLSEIEEDYLLLLESVKRLEKNSNEKTISMKKVMEQQGITEDDLEGFEDINIE